MSRHRDDPPRPIDEAVTDSYDALRTPVHVESARVEAMTDPVAPIRWDAPACLVEVYGDDPGRRIDLSAACTRIGRVEPNDVVIQQSAVSRFHAEIGQTEHGHTLIDRESTNGTFVNDQRVRNARLRHGDYLKIGGSVFRFLQAEDLEAAFGSERERLRRVDGLTQLMRSEAFVEIADGRLRGGDGEVSIVAVEVEDLEHLRQRFGVAAADRVLSLLAGLILQRLRQADVLARTGDASFSVLLDGASLNAATVVAEKLRRFVGLSTFRFQETPIPVRIRTGVAAASRGGGVLAEDLLLEARAALNAARDPLPG